MNPARAKPPPEAASTRDDHENWLRMWRKGQTDDFHQIAVNPLLKRFWASQPLATPARIFVPLCGKSLDLLWLVAQDNEVIGVELSPVAVKAFFAENGLTPTKHKRGKLTLYQSGRLHILCGDFFKLTPDDLGDIDVVYDRAALTALPESLREHYVAHLRAIVPPACQIFLLTVADADPLDTPADEIDDEIRTLYTRHFEIDMAHMEAGIERDETRPADAPVAVEHKVYRLTPRVT